MFTTLVDDQREHIQFAVSEIMLLFAFLKKQIKYFHKKQKRTAFFF